VTLSEQETEIEGERGKKEKKNEKEKEIGIAIRIEKIEIEGRTETVTGVVGKRKGKEKGIGWTERETSEGATPRNILRALETVAHAVVGKQIHFCTIIVKF
jgi:hypothetical protein